MPRPGLVITSDLRNKCQIRDLAKKQLREDLELTFLEERPALDAGTFVGVVQKAPKYCKT